MKITFISHASIKIETQGMTILSDPWWQAPCFGAQWWNYPEPNLAAVDYQNTDYVYISHGHHDHCHPGTLKKFSRDTKILASAGLDIIEPIRKLGFEVIPVSPDAPVHLGEGVRCHIWPTYSHDTLMVLDDGDETCANLNDALHAAPRRIQDRFIEQLNNAFGQLDYVFSGYGIASHFPNCYLIPGKDDAATAIERQHHFNQQWVHLINGLQPKMAYPFAASVVFLEPELIEINAPVHNAERPTDLFEQTHPNSPVQVIDISPGYVVEAGQTQIDQRFQPIETEQLKRTMVEEQRRAVTYQETSSDQINDLMDKLVDNIASLQDYLLECDDNYRFLIRFRVPTGASNTGIAIHKRGDRIDVQGIDLDKETDDDYDVTYLTRAVYLKQSLTQPYGHEILFVGSGGIFIYGDKTKADKNLHRELARMIRLHDKLPPSRFGDNPKWLFKLKQFVKKCLRRPTTDLYDLKRWIKYQ